MLFLIEPPAKRARVPPVRSGENLLNLGDEEDGYDEEYNMNTSRRLDLSNVSYEGRYEGSHKKCNERKSVTKK